MCLLKISIKSQKTPIIGKDKEDIEYLIHKFAIITSVIAVPILAHKITHNEFWKVITQAHTKANVIKETTLLLCKTVVTKTQVDIAL